MDDLPDSTAERGEGEQQRATWTVPVQRPGEIAAARRRIVPGGGWGAKLARAPELIPGVAAVAVFGYWSLTDGGVLPTESYPGGIALLGLLVATGFAYRQRLVELPRLPRLAIILLACFVVWNFLSISWADDQGAAWDGANRCLMYLLAFTLFAIPPWRAHNALILLGLYALMEAAIAAGSLIAAANTSDPLNYFVAGRFASPTNYHNASAALFSCALFPALFLSSRRETPWLARGVMLAAAGILFQVALLPQSRGWLLALPLATVAYFALVPGRVRSLIVLAPLAAVAALSAGAMLDVFDSFTTAGALEPALGHAENVMLLSTVILLVAGWAIGLADTAIELPERTARRATQVVGAGAVAAVAVAAVIAIAAIGSPASWVSDHWNEFKSGEAEHSFSSSRLTQGLGSNRYDFWRVATHEFRDHPMTGVGTENFAADYLRDRHTTEEPFHPHSLPLRILAQTGLVGAALFIGFLGAAFLMAGRIRFKTGSAPARGAAGAVFVFFAYWALHSSGDWFWAFPALTAPVFAFMGMATRLDAEPSPISSPRITRQVTIAGAACAVVALISLALPWMSAIYVKEASQNWPQDPSRSFKWLDRARSLNFLSDQPDLVAATIATRLGDQDRARSAFEGALSRNPTNWYPRLELAALDALQGHDATALAGLAKVEELNPREELIGDVRAGIQSGHPITLGKIDEILRERVCTRLGQSPTSEGCAAG